MHESRVRLKNIIMRKTLLLGSLLSLLLMNFSSCDKEPCEEDRYCTMVLVAVTLKVQSATGEPVRLDEAYTIRQSTGEIINHTQNMSASGVYVVLDDAYRASLYRSRQDDFKFVGKIGGRTVVEENYTIGADECHIVKRAGKDSVVAN
jgi:hypothetical protein